MTIEYEYRIKEVRLFNPEVARTKSAEEITNVDFDKVYFVPHKRYTPARYQWWITLFGPPNKSEWIPCAPIDEVKDCCFEWNPTTESNEAVSILDTAAADRVHWFSDRKVCEAWIDRLRNKPAAKYTPYPIEMSSLDL